MSRTILSLPALALVAAATLGTATAASYDHAQGMIVSIDRAEQSLKLLNGSVFHFETAGEMRGLHPGGRIAIAYDNGGERNLIAQFRMQSHPN